MELALLIAVGFGYYVGLSLGYYLTKWMINKSEVKCARVCGRIFAWLSLAPALYLGDVEGSNLGGIVGRDLLGSLGLNMVGLPVGIWLGIVITIILIISSAVMLGMLFGILLDVIFSK